MDDRESGHGPIDEERIFFFDRQEVTLGDFEAQGFILDIGGGGEGVIGQLKGAQVVAIDPSRRELAEAANGPLKVVMDARDLQFLDGAFNTATAFFTLMYIPADDHRQVLEEIYRVLAPGGRLLIWDAVIPAPIEEGKDVAVFPLSVHLPDREIGTGYGTRWPSQPQGLEHYVALAEAVGFEIAGRWQRDRALFLDLRKPT
jgi:SAM-dependent methyltransferase